MKKYQHHKFLFIVMAFSISILLLFACTADDDDDDQPDPTATPTATQTATYTPTLTPTAIPTPTMTPDIPCYFSDVTVDGEAYSGEEIVTWSGNDHVIQFYFGEGSYWTAETSNFHNESVHPTYGEGTGYFTATFHTGAPSLGGHRYVDFFGDDGECTLRVRFYVV